MQTISKFRDYYDPIGLPDDERLKFYRGDVLRVDTMPTNDSQRLRIERTHADVTACIQAIIPETQLARQHSPLLPDLRVNYGVIVFAGVIYPFAHTELRWINGRNSGEFHYSFDSMRHLPDRAAGTHAADFNAAAETFFKHAGNTNHREHFLGCGLGVAVFTKGGLHAINARLLDFHFWNALNANKAQALIVQFVAEAQARQWPMAA